MVKKPIVHIFAVDKMDINKLLEEYRQLQRTRSIQKIFKKTMAPLIQFKNVRYIPRFGSTAFGGAEYLKAYEEFFKEEGQHLFEGHEELLTYLRKHAGGDFKTTRSAWYLYATLSTEHVNGLKLPDWTASIFPEKLSKLAFGEYIAQTATKQLKRLIVGNLMRKILTDTKAKINGASSRKIHLYSCHDNMIAASLNFFNLLPLYHFPKYAACIILEVHNIDNKYVIKLLYRQSKDADLQYMTFSNETVYLNLEEFAEIVDDLFIEDKS